MIDGRRAFLAAAVGLCGLSVGLAAIEDEPEPVLAPMSVEVLNGCGRDQLGAQVAAQLRAMGQDVRSVTNAGKIDQARTVLIDRRGRPRLSERLARSLGGVPLLLERIDSPAADVTLLLGADFAEFEPLAAAASPDSHGD